MPTLFRQPDIKHCQGEARASALIIVLKILQTSINNEHTYKLSISIYI